MLTTLQWQKTGACLGEGGQAGMGQMIYKHKETFENDR